MTRENDPVAPVQGKLMPADESDAALLRVRLAAVVDSSDDAIVTKTLEGIVTTWNRGAERIFGYTADEIVGKSITTIFPPDRLDEEPRILAAIRSGERLDHYETVRRRKDGTLINVSVTVSPLYDASGKIIGASKIARDITRQKRAEAALREDARVLDVLNKTGALIASQLDLQNLVQSVIDAATELAGARFGAFFYNLRNAEGELSLVYAVSGAPRAAFDALGMPRETSLFGPTFRGDALVRSDDITKDPRYGTMEPHRGLPPGHLPVKSYLAVPVVARGGTPVGALFFGHPDPGVFTERTERIMVGIAAQSSVALDNARLYDDAKRSAEERNRLLEAERAARGEAERANQMKDEFLTTVSHELRTPLNAILGWSQALGSGAVPEERFDEALEAIERNARAQTQLIEDLLDMGRIVSGKLRMDVQEVDLQAVIQAAVATVRHAADVKGVRLQLILDPLVGPVRGDPNRLQQCFWNLLSNAIKFTQKGGKVQVTLERVDSHVEVTVADNGQGIKPDFLPFVFDRFRQADASVTRRRGGLGIGLSIVKSLVELHGGEVRVSSPGEGQGAVFSVHLPLMVTHTPAVAMPTRGAVPSSKQPVEHPSLEGITVLVVDDEADARELLRFVLESCKARVLVASSAREAWDLITRERPDMIVSDIGLPDVDGYELMRKVRQLTREEGGQTPAAALTALARSADRTRALRAGYQTHIPKPVDPTELTAVVASLAFRSQK